MNGRLDDDLRRRCAVVREWLEAGRGTFGPLVTGDLEAAPVLDLTAGGPDLADVEEPSDAAVVASLVQRRLADSGASVVLGRHAEERAIYDLPAFTNEDGTRRDLHLGIDLFQQAGSSVRAPFDGTVHGFADNAEPFDYGPTIVLRHRVPDTDVVFFSLWGHLSRDSLDGPFEALVVRRGDEVGRLGTSAENGGWAPHLHFQLTVDLLGHYGTFPGVVSSAERADWLELCPDPSPVLGLPVSRVVARGG